MKLTYIPGATPLDHDDLSDLKPNHITSQAELNEWEAANISQASTWLFKKNKLENLLTFEFIKLLHNKMFNQTWKWAGKFRQKELNIGVAPHKIYEELKKLLEDVSYQIENKTFSLDEIAYRFHHRLVFIHLFPNGNGRHARMITDALLLQNSRPSFSWGSANLGLQNSVRKIYLDALRSADKGNYKLLSEFVRT